MLALACVTAAAFGNSEAQPPDSARALARPDSTAADSSNAADDLRATSAPPWNPPRATHDERPWETVLRLPGRIVTLPLSLLGYGARSDLLFVESNNLVPRAIAVFASAPHVGFYLIPASLGDHTGTGVALELRPPRISQFLTSELSASTQHYHRTRVDLTLGPLSADYGYEWRPRDQFFGIGRDTKRDSVSEFAVQGQRLRAQISLPAQKRKQPPPRRQIQAWAGTRELVMRQSRGSKQSFDQAYPEIGATQVDQKVENITYGGRAYSDTRAGVPHWTHGMRLEAQADFFVKTTRDLAFETATENTPQFARYSGSFATGFSFMRDPRTIRLGVRAIHQALRQGSAAMRIYDLSGLGGNRGLYGFEPGRFYDLDMIVGQITYLFPLTEHFEVDVHTELGSVYHNVLEDPSLSSLENSYGVLLRPRSRRLPLGMVGVDWSREGVRFRFSFGGVE